MIVFNEGFLDFANIMIDIKTGILIKIYKIESDVIKGERLINIGWSLFPIFISPKYVNSIIG